MNENIFDKLDFGPFRSLLDNDDITDISYDNGGQIWIRSLTQGSMRVEIEGATPEFVEKLAFQCSNVMGTTFNNAKPFLDAESAELRMNFVHQSIATNGIALVIRKTPAKIRLDRDKLIKEDYFTPAIHDLLIKCVVGHCNIMVAGETGSGKTEFIKYLASHTIQNEKIITIEDTLELHLDKIYPQRDIVAMKTNNVASYTDVLVTCMRQNPKWILLSEVRSAEAVSAVRNSISSGHNILSTIHADKASAIPYRLYSLMETDLDVNQFLNTIYRYIQIGVHIKAYYSKEYGQFHREVDEVCEFYVNDNNEPVSRIIYQKQMGKIVMCKPSAHLQEYLGNQNIDIQDIIKHLPEELPIVEMKDGEAVVIDPNEPKAKPDEVEETKVGSDLGAEESVPEVGEDGNVKLSETIVHAPDQTIEMSPVEDKKEDSEPDPNALPDATPEVAIPEQPAVPALDPNGATAQVPAVDTSGATVPAVDPNGVPALPADPAQATGAIPAIPVVAGAAQPAIPAVDPAQATGAIPAVGAEQPPVPQAMDPSQAVAGQTPDQMVNQMLANPAQQAVMADPNQMAQPQIPAVAPQPDMAMQQQVPMADPSQGPPTIAPNVEQQIVAQPQLATPDAAGGVVNAEQVPNVIPNVVTMNG